MCPGHQKQLGQYFIVQRDCNVILRLTAESGHDQALGILLAGAAGGREEKIRLLGGHQLADTGEALAVRSGLSILAKLFSRGSAEPFLNGFAVTVLLLLLQEISQLTAGQLPAQLQQLRNGDVDMDFVRLPLTHGLVQVVGRKDEVGSAVAKGIGKALHEAVPCILSDDLIRIPFRTHDAPSTSGEECHPAAPASPSDSHQTGA